MNFKPWLWIPPQIAHDIAPWTLPMVSAFYGGHTPVYKEKTWRNLQFKNPLGIAGGVDKNGTAALSWQKLGAGFLEIGTVTPRPQSANPGRILDRNLKYHALWNKMGFPNRGAQSLQKKLVSLSPKIKVPLFINIGKNRATDNSAAHEDYIACMDLLHPFADAFVINISSPNTKDLRQLLGKEQLQSFLDPILNFKLQKNIQTPILIKLSPDMKVDGLLEVLDLTLTLKLDGWILTNTTTERHPAVPFPLEGGMSGAPLAALAKSNLQTALRFLKEKKKDQLVISTGGIMSPSDIRERLAMGADLVQFYSALIFNGPLFFINCLKELQSQH